MYSYSIVEDVKVPCKIVAVEKKDGFWVMKIAAYSNGEILCHLVKTDWVMERMQSIYKELMHTQRLLFIHRVTLKPDVKVYKRFDYADWSNHLCSFGQIGEIQRDKEGVAIQYNQVVVYANFMDKGKPTEGEVYIKQYVEVTSPMAQKALAYRHAEQKDPESYDSYDNISFDPWLYEENRRNMSDEELIMDALEEGNAECFGF